MNEYINMKTPEISVVLTVFNGERYIQRAINSILSQTFPYFELILIDDGSTDKTPYIIGSYSDPRIIFLQNKENQGIPTSLNRGLSIAKGKYIAIMDADDISMPDRFSKQFNFLENNPEIGICGTWINLIDEEGKQIGNTRYPVSSTVISCLLLFYCCIAHPTTMYRKSTAMNIGCYDTNFIAAMDYHLWTKIIGHMNFSNIPEFLLDYRIHESSISHDREKYQHEDYIIRKNAIETFLNQPLTEKEDAAVYAWIRPRSKMKLNEIYVIDELISKIYKKTILNKKISYGDQQEINLFFAKQVIHLAKLSRSISVIKFVQLFIHGIRYHPAVLLIIFKDVAKSIVNYIPDYSKK